jgi:hypothetical protein
MYDSPPSQKSSQIGHGLTMLGCVKLKLGPYVSWEKEIII